MEYARARLIQRADMIERGEDVEGWLWDKEGEDEQPEELMGVKERRRKR